MPIKSILIVLALTGWGLAFWALRQPERTVTKTEYKDRIITKKQVKIVTTPDGTTTETRVVETDKTAQQISAAPTNRPLPKYSLGLSYKLDLTTLNHKNETYTLQLNRRLWESPVWTTITIASDRSIAVGFLVEF